MTTLSDRLLRPPPVQTMLAVKRLATARHRGQRVPNRIAGLRIEADRYAVLA